ncbi:hypothetical protein HYU11_00070 [Candidatus Woesearchaeota archaeon]|nr:hypothetical protein [Candidatus Woesearchaeota archaeon]
MKQTIILAILLIFIIGCARQAYQNETPSRTSQLVLNENDLQQLGMAGTGCNTEEYPTSENSPLAQYTFCNYTINRLKNSEVVLELQKFTNFEDLNGTYQYTSLHLRGSQGLISENDYGDFSRFYVNNESTIYYYHLWIGKNKYIIHITSKGSKEDGEYIAKTGRQILLKFG